MGIILQLTKTTGAWQELRERRLHLLVERGAAGHAVLRTRSQVVVTGVQEGRLLQRDPRQQHVVEGTLPHAEALKAVRTLKKHLVRPGVAHRIHSIGKMENNNKRRRRPSS